MSYIINKSDGTTLLSLGESTISTDACSLALVGRRATTYGESIAENFVKLLENHCKDTAPAYPLMGQFWFEKTAKKLKIYDSASSTWFTIATITVNGLNVSGNQLISTCLTPTPPLVVASRAKCVDLNADLLDGYDTSISTIVSTIPVRNASGDIFAAKFQGVATSSQYADLAERFEASEFLEEGDIVRIGGEKEICKAEFGSHFIGVISTKPGVRMNEDAGPDDTHPFVGYIGRVPVKSTGVVNKGDELFVSMTVPGVASTQRAGMSVGIALESGAGDLHLINTLIGR